MTQLSHIKENIDTITYETVCRIPCDVIAAEFSQSDISTIIKTVIDHYYANGFPYYEKDKNRMLTDFVNVSNSTVDKIEIGNELQQNMAGLYFVNCFHSEMWEVICNKAKTPMDVFNDRNLFYNAIKKRIGLSDTPLHPYNIRKSLKVFNGVQNVSNFRPTISKYIYDKYCPENGSVLDPCMGYGGRLMGAFLSEKVSSYRAVDPNQTTVTNNQLMLLQLIETEKIKSQENIFHEQRPRHFDFICSPFEDYYPMGMYDLIFTSPPYFNIEKYSNDETQSWVRYKTLDKWMEKFIVPLVAKSYWSLKKDGHFIINIDGGEKITKRFQEIAAECFDLVEIKYMRLSKIMGNRKTNTDKFKLESIFIYKHKTKNQ